MHADSVVGAMDGVDRAPLGAGAIIGLAEETADFALPLAHFGTKHLDAGAFENGAAIVDIEIVAAVDWLDHCQVGGVLR